MSAPEPKEIREAFRDYRNEWQDIRDEANADMQAISVEGPWSTTDRAQREGAHRPCIHEDQINQFLNQTIGNVRKNPRAVKAMPKGDGANDADAKSRSALIMGIEERSQAQPIYLYCFECQIERSYGFAVIRTEYRDNQSFDQDIVIRPIMNPDTVLLSPHYKQPNASDVPEAFLIDRISKAKFQEKYPEAKITDFSGEIMGEDHVSDWVTTNMVQVGEYWRVEYDRSKLLLIETQKGPIVFTEKEWAQAKETVKGSVKRERTVETPRVMQYMTNGLEVLDKIQWAGTRIPIISCLGPERWVTEGGTAKRQLLSMVRFARDPQMMYDYLTSGQAEVAKKIPKVPFIGAKGQFESDSDAWNTATDIPHSYLQYDAITDPTGQNVLPPPQFTQYSANFQEWEVAKDAAARAIQAAMGITPLPTAAARRNEKSGVALEKIDDMESLGSFHFVDRYENGFLHNMGWQINELITPILDTERQMPVTEPDGSRSLLHVVGQTSHPIDESGQYEVQDLPEEHVHTGKGEFDVTISTGPSYDSERQEQSEFVDQLINNLPNLPPPNTPQAKVLALGIRMRPTLGPVGQQIADVFDPPDPNNLPPQAQAAIQNLQAQVQQLQQENIALHADRAGRVLEQQTKIQLQQMKSDNDTKLAQLQNDIKVLVAEIQAKSQDSAERIQMYKEFWLENHGAAHEQAMQEDQQAHDHMMADKQAQIAVASQATQIQADQQSQQAQQQSQ
jgi:hypothetical protein